MALYNKYRPTKLEDVAGNESLKTKLNSFFKKDDKPQAYIIEGKYGCGKTSLANIIAKEYGASELSVREINGSDNNGVDDARKLTDDASMLPIDSSVQVFIIDEAHNGSGKFWDCLLTTIERPPKHSVFIFCTTEITKIPKNIQSRCQILTVESLEAKVLGPLLLSVCKKEKVVVDKEVLKEIVKKSDGSARNGLNILESVVQYTTTEEMMQSIKSLNNTEETEEFILLCKSLMNGSSWNVISSHLKTIKIAPESLRYKILSYLGSVLLSGNCDCDAVRNAIAFFEDSFTESGQAGLIGACYDCSID